MPQDLEAGQGQGQGEGSLSGSVGSGGSDGALSGVSAVGCTSEGPPGGATSQPGGSPAGHSPRGESTNPGGGQQHAGERERAGSSASVDSPKTIILLAEGLKTFP